MSGLLKFCILLGALFAAGCYYDNEEDLYPNPGCETDNVTYAGVVAPILQSNCNSCHSAAVQFGGVILDSYEQVQVQVTNGRLLGAIKREAGFSPMPQNQPKMPACTIEKIEVWIQNGALNN